MLVICMFYLLEFVLRWVLCYVDDCDIALGLRLKGLGHFEQRSCPLSHSRDKRPCSLCGVYYLWLQHHSEFNLYNRIIIFDKFAKQPSLWCAIHVDVLKWQLTWPEKKSTSTNIIAHRSWYLVILTNFSSLATPKVVNGNLKVVSLIKFSSLAALEVISSGASYENVFKMTTFPFQCTDQGIVCWVIIVVFTISIWVP